MRVVVLVVAIVLAIIFVGGVIKLGGTPVFARIDSRLGTTFLMDVHYAVFSFAHRGQQRAEESVGRAKSGVDDLQQKAEFGKKQKYKRLDKASEY